MRAHLRSESLRGLLLDVEGTTTPVDFVYGTLFPYVRAHVREFFSPHAEDREIRSDIERLRLEQQEDLSSDNHPPEWRPDSVVDSAAAYVSWLMDQDRKSTALKTIQGKIWNAGYRDGQLHGEVFDDVRPSFERWTQDGFEIRIFSSGSVLAQQLLFRHSTAGDLTRFISGYFDTTTGAKTFQASYVEIASAFGLPPAAILFVSDSIEELAPAFSAGYRVLLSLRPGNQPIPGGPTGYKWIRSFEEILC